MTQLGHIIGTADKNTTVTHKHTRVIISRVDLNHMSGSRGTQFLIGLLRNPRQVTNITRYGHIGALQTSTEA